MKTTFLLSSGFILAILNSSLAFGQDRDKIPLPISPFSQGDINIDLPTNVNFSLLNQIAGNNNSRKQNNFGLQYGGTYFLVDNVGVGLGISSDISKEMIEQVEILNSSTTGSLHAIYGTSLSSGINIYGKVAVKKGIEKYEYTSPSYTQDSKIKVSGLNFEFGSPIDIGESGFYATPYLAYDYSVNKDDYQKDKFSGLYLGTRLNLSLPCGSFARNCEQVQEFSDNMYTQGTNVIGGYTGFRLNFGTGTNTYSGENGNSGDDVKSSYFGGMIKAEYYHYLFDDIAFGGDFGINTSGHKIKETDNKQNEFSWMFMPKVQVNLPVPGKLHNTFGFAGYGLGGSTVKTSHSSQTNETKESKFSLALGAGYNIFFARDFTFVPILNYSWLTSENKETSVKNKWNGPEMSLSLRHSF